MTRLQNPGLKLLALALAGSFWFSATAERREPVGERDFKEVPIVVSAIPQHLIVTQTSHDTLRVRFRAREHVYSEVSAQRLEATIDLSESRAGEVTAVIRPQALNLPSGVEVLSITPAKVTFRLEQKRQRLVPIHPFIQGEPPPHLRVGAISVEPVNALVTGPLSVVREFTEATTERIILGTQTSSFSVNVGVVSDRSLARIVEPTAARVTIELLPIELPPPPPTSTSLEPTGPTSASTSTEGSARIARPGQAQ